MTIEEIKSNLCYWDKENPECIFNDEEILDHQKIVDEGYKRCMCDNCFYGRTKLAKEIIKLLSDKQ